MQNFQDFLSHLPGQKEVSLVIVGNQGEFAELSSQLDNADYKLANHPRDLMTHPKIYTILGSSIEKDVYDFISQYPTGQVELFNAGDMRSEVSQPDYEGKVVLALVTKDDLAEIEKQGFDILSKIGMTYRS